MICYRSFELYEKRKGNKAEKYSKSEQQYLKFYKNKKNTFEYVEKTFSGA